VAAPNEEFSYEEVQGLRGLARKRIEAGELPAELVSDEQLRYPEPGPHLPDDRPRDRCRLCDALISPNVIWWHRLAGPPKKTEPFGGTRPELHTACYIAWRIEVTNAAPPGFTEYALGTSAEKGPLRFFGRVLAQAEGERDSGTVRHVLYETSDGDFVGEATVVCRFTEARRFETQERAFSWFGDKALKAELLRQLAESKSK